MWEIHAAARIGQQRFDGAYGTNAGIGFRRGGKDIVKVGGMPGTGVEGGEGFFDRGLGMGEEGGNSPGDQFADDPDHFRLGAFALLAAHRGDFPKLLA